MCTISLPGSDTEMACCRWSVHVVREVQVPIQGGRTLICQPLICQPLLLRGDSLQIKKGARELGLAALAIIPL